MNAAQQFQAAGGQSIDTTRRKYLTELHNYKGRNIIAYYSGWLSKPTVMNLGIVDEDKNGFMMACHNIDKYKDWPKPGPDLTHIAAKTSQKLFELSSINFKKNEA